jgi:hypothetical protein
MSTANEYVSNPVDISPNDLIIRSRGFSEFQRFDESLLRFVAGAIVELSDCGGTDGCSAAEFVCSKHPEAGLRWDRECIEEIAQLLLEADIVSVSKHYTELFAEFNARYFCGRLHPYELRVVFDLHMVTNEPIYMGHVSSRRSISDLIECSVPRRRNSAAFPGASGGSNWIFFEISEVTL